jgi:hypothetical protein
MEVPVVANQTPWATAAGSKRPNWGGVSPTAAVGATRTIGTVPGYANPTAISSRNPTSVESGGGVQNRPAASPVSSGAASLALGATGHTPTSVGLSQAGRTFNSQLARDTEPTRSTLPPGAPPPSPYGTESGPGILEQWFNQRAGGTDPGWEYGMGRATAELNRQAAARGGFNSSASMRSLSDLYSGAVSQRESQLDALAGGASGEHQGRLNSMFNESLGLANGQAGAASGYDINTGNNMSQMDVAQIQLALDKAGVDQKTRQAILGTITSGIQGGISLASGKPGG